MEFVNLDTTLAVYPILALPENCEFVVNFAPELTQVISEAKYLEKLGFPIPDLARSVALQEEKFIAFQDGLNHVLHRYHHVLSTLTEAEVMSYVVYYIEDTRNA